MLRRLAWGGGGVLCVTDTGFNLIAVNSCAHAPSAEYETLLESGAYTSAEIELLLEGIGNLNQKQSFFQIAPHFGNDVNSVHFPIFVDGSYVYHLTYASGKDAFTDGFVDRFAKVAQRVAMLGTSYWRDNLLVASSCHKTLISLIRGEKRDQDNIESQMERSGIPVSASYRLITFDFPDDLSFEAEGRLIEAAAGLNEGNCHGFFMERKLLVLVFNEDRTPTRNSLFRLIKELNEKIYSPFGVASGVSQIFSDIKDIKYALRQCELAFQNGEALVRLFPGGYESITGNTWPCYPFDHVLPFLSLDINIDSDFIKYSMADNNLIRTLRKDKGFESESTNIIWLYLVSERNATRAASLAHVHRNTVLYQIKKFEERYDLDLELPMVRLRIRFDFAYWIMNGGDEDAFMKGLN